MENETQTQVQEQASETVVEKVKETLTEVAQKIAAEVKEAKGEAVAEVKKAVQALETEDKLIITKLENTYLKLQVELQQHSAEINRIQNLVKEVTEKFQKTVDGLFVKYERNKTEDFLDVAEHIFRPVQKN